ncbi:hypothetical protein CEXT_158461 [Caerostris extrusa]|uniref:Uncharacterized protein n=1 Tax=Caerostris extrusa TaxID=172846 RepID=A0AAV4X1P4_CAEEX|nr:hypothetical protein CEXT_158461 [Caerostris extrusa]
MPQGHKTSESQGEGAVLKLMTNSLPRCQFYHPFFRNVCRLYPRPAPSAPPVTMASVIREKASPQPMQQPPIAHMFSPNMNHTQVLQHHLLSQSTNVIVPRIPPNNHSYNSLGRNIDGVLDLSNSEAIRGRADRRKEVDEDDKKSALALTGWLAACETKGGTHDLVARILRKQLSPPIRENSLYI